MLHDSPIFSHYSVRGGSAISAPVRGVRGARSDRGVRGGASMLGPRLGCRERIGRCGLASSLLASLQKKNWQFHEILQIATYV